MENLLENWKKECYNLTSIFNYKKSIDLKRSDIDTTYNTLLDYFGDDYFQDNKPNWLYTLLANYKQPACILLLFEVSDLLIYVKTLNKSVQSKLRSFIQEPKQFRDMLFELFTYRVLDFNRIPNVKKPFEGKKELEGTCTINAKEYLFECRKLYAPDTVLLETLRFTLDKIYSSLKLLNKGIGLIGTIQFKNVNSQHNSSTVEAKIDELVKHINEGVSMPLFPIEDNNDEVELIVREYDIPTNIEIDEKHEEYHIVFKYIPPASSTLGIANLYGVTIGASFGIPRWKLYRKLFSAIDEKRAQHSQSKYKNKIYFIDSEFIPDLSLPIFQNDSMFDDQAIQSFVDSMSQDEIVCFVRREYIGHLPKIIFKAFGKNIDNEVKSILENMSPYFAYLIEGI